MVQMLSTAVVLDITIHVGLRVLGNFINVIEVERDFWSHVLHGIMFEAKYKHGVLTRDVTSDHTQGSTVNAESHIHYTCAV